LIASRTEFGTSAISRKTEFDRIPCARPASLDSIARGGNSEYPTVRRFVKQNVTGSIRLGGACTAGGRVNFPRIRRCAAACTRQTAAKTWVLGIKAPGYNPPRSAGTVARRQPPVFDWPTRGRKPTHRTASRSRPLAACNSCKTG
jgi:hypothetical protein